MEAAVPLPAKREPFAARLHVVTRLNRNLQNAIVRALRPYFTRAPGWVLLTTRGRKTGLRREVLLPCERFADGILVISTYGWRSDWIRNIQKDGRVWVTCGGWVIAATAEIVEDLVAKRRLVAAHPFVPPAPFALVHVVMRTLLRPLLVFGLQRWVTVRPVIVIRPVNGVDETHAA